MRDFQLKYGTLFFSLKATIDSLSREDTVKDITEDQWVEIDNIYNRLLKIQKTVVMGTPPEKCNEP
jgi:hypothetical protein